MRGKMENSRNNYRVFDVNGLVGDFVTASGLKLFKNFLADEGWASTLEFILTGAAINSIDLADEIEEMESFNSDIQSIIMTLRELFAKADTVMIVNNDYGIE